MRSNAYSVRLGNLHFKSLRVNFGKIQKLKMFSRHVSLPKILICLIRITSSRPNKVVPIIRNTNEPDDVTCIVAKWGSQIHTNQTKIRINRS